MPLMRLWQMERSPCASVGAFRMPTSSSGSKTAEWGSPIPKTSSFRSIRPSQREVGLGWLWLSKSRVRMEEKSDWSIAKMPLEHGPSFTCRYPERLSASLRDGQEIRLDLRRDHAVATVVLGAIERSVSNLDHLFVVVRESRRYAETRSNRERL